MTKAGSIFWCIVFTVLVFLNINTINQKKSLVLELEKNALALATSREELKTIQKRITSHELFYLQNEGVRINKNLILTIGSSDHPETYILSDLLTADGYTLVVNLPQINCTSCSNEDMWIVKKLAEISDPSNVLILSRYRSINDMQTFKRLNQLELDIYNKHEGGLGLTVGEGNFTFLFLVNMDLTTKHLFIPDYNTPELAEQYFDIIYEKLGL